MVNQKVEMITKIKYNKDRFIIEGERG